MAKTTPAPLTDEEKATLADLRAREQAEADAQNKAAAEARVAALAPVRDFVEAAGSTAIMDKLTVAINSRPDPDTYQQLIQIRQLFDFNFNQLRQAINAADAAANPPPSAPVN